MKNTVLLMSSPPTPACTTFAKAAWNSRSLAAFTISLIGTLAQTNIPPGPLSGGQSLRRERKRGMDVRALKELCQRLDELATTADIIDGLTSADLHRVASAALRGALAEI